MGYSPHQLRTETERLLDLLGGFRDQNTQDVMLSKGFTEGSLHRSMIVDLLHDYISQGGDAIDLLRRTLLVFAGELGTDHPASKKLYSIVEDTLG